MKKRTLYTVLFIILAGLIISITKDFKGSEQETIITQHSEKQDIKDSGLDVINIQKQGQETPNSLPIKERIWDTVLRYKEAARTHNLEGVTSLAYKVSSTCSDAKKDKNKEAPCFKNLDSAYELLNSLNKSEFEQVLSDDKQAILISKLQTEEDENKKTAKRTFFYFIIDNGAPKVLGIDMERSHSIEKEGKNSTEIDNELSKKLVDTDLDGTEDIIEKCEISNISSCKKTDPNKKDTDNNGYWDSIDPLL